MRRLAAWHLLLLLACPAGAVLIDGQDGSTNTTPPPDDPGFAHVGNKQGLTAVYIGSGWVLTAAHVGTGPVVLGGVSFAYQPESLVQIQPEAGAAILPDLAMFRIEPQPPLPDLRIRREPLAIGMPVTLIGNGTDRGPATTWLGHGGYRWAAAHSIRWGTNLIHAFHPTLVRISRQTDSFSTEFTQSVGPNECQASNGDSGGAVFAKDAEGTWELAGIMHSVENLPGQPAATAFYTNWIYAANLPVYRDQILAIRDASVIPAVAAPGVAMLGALVAGSGARLLRARAPRPDVRKRPAERPAPR